MNDSLLSHIASKFITQYENVANSSICYLLTKYKSAQQALKKIVDLEDYPVRYVTELSTQQNGRPDVTGLNIDGNKAIIIEGKFWANLTSNQPVNYLQELKPGGKLLFIVPNRRIESIKQEIKRRTNNDDKQIRIVSWINFLNAIESENLKDLDHNLVSDIVQLKELCSKMDEEGLPPLSEADLDPMNGRISYQLADLLDECRDLIRQWEGSDFEGLKATSWKLGYGFYFRAYGFGCQLYFSSYRWFVRKSHTPIWLTIKDEKYTKSEKIFNALIKYNSNDSYNDEDCAAFAIVLKPGMDRGEAVQWIVNSVQKALLAVKAEVDSDGQQT